MNNSVSIIIVSYYTGPTLWLAIASSLRQAECSEVIIVNNGNIAADERRLRDLAALDLRIKLIEGQGNVGFGKANNLGAAIATSKYLLLLNPDTMLPENVVSTLLAEMSAYPENTLAGCYLVNPDGSEQRGGRRALLSPENAAVEAFSLHKIFKSFKNVNYNTLPMPDHTHYVPAISGAFMCIARTFYTQLGGFDEAYFLHMEDMDLCYRVNQVGGKIICIPSVKVMHFRSTSEVTSNFIEKQKARGFIIYLDKFFKQNYSKILLNAMKFLIILRCWLKIILGQLNRAFVPPLTAKTEIARITALYSLAYFSERSDVLAGKTIIVTGASSQLGIYTIGKALAQGAHVIAVYQRHKIEFSHPHLEWRKFYLDHKDDIAEFVTIKADVLVHAAKLSLLPKWLGRLYDNGLGRVIVFSHGLMQEKIGSETIADIENNIVTISENHKRPITILRPVMCYGSGFANNITKMADVIRRFRKMAISGEASGLRNPANISDIADVALAIIDNPKTYGKIYNLGGNTVLSYHDIITRIAKFLGKTVTLLHIPFYPQILNFLGHIYQLPDINGEVVMRMNMDICADNQLALEDFGYNPHNFLEGDIIL